MRTFGSSMVFELGFLLVSEGIYTYVFSTILSRFVSRASRAAPQLGLLALQIDDGSSRPLWNLSLLFR